MSEISQMGKPPCGYPDGDGGKCGYPSAWLYENPQTETVDFVCDLCRAQIVDLVPEFAEYMTALGE